MKTADDPAAYSSPQASNPKFSNRLCAALLRLAAPVAGHAGFAIATTTSGHIEWLIRHRDCVCGEPKADPAQHSGIRSREVVHGNAIAGRILLCTIGGNDSLTSIVENLIEESIQLVELELEDELFIRELGSNWESLHTLYEISSDLRTLRNIPDILGRILDRIVAARPSLCAVLWIAREDCLMPTVARRAEVSKERRTDAGILGRAASTRTPVVINDRTHARIDAAIEPELLHAERIALVPIATRDRLVGMLEIWQDEGLGQFDSPTIRLFEALSIQAAMVLESERAYRASLAEERLRREIEIGGRIQETLLLGSPPATLPGVQIGVLTVPSHAIDGDFFDFLPCGSDCLDVFVGDVMGKGIPAALVGAAAKSDLLRAFGQLTAANLARRLPSPREIVTHVHQHLTGRLIDLESFISLYYSRFDLQHMTLDFVECGHPRAIHYSSAAGTLEFLAGDGMPLGIVEGGSYTQTTIAFAPGDIFLFYSDGVTEAHNAVGEPFGSERILSCFRSNAGMEPARLCAVIRDAVAEFTGSRAVADDFTCLAVKIGAPQKGASSMRWAMEFLSHLEFLPALRAWVRGVCASAGVDDRRAADSLELAVTESASNIIRHAYEGRTGKRILIEAQIYPDHVAIMITHWGKRFRPASEPLRMPEADAGHGYGLYIISKMVDRVSYFDGPHGADSVLLEKFLSKTAGGEDSMLATMEQRGDVTVVRVALDTLDASNDKRFKKEVVSALAPGSKVVLDLGKVNFIDSSGLGVILSCYRHLHGAGGDLKLCCLNEQVRTLFELVRMHRIFDTCGTCEEALSSFMK